MSALAILRVFWQLPLLFGVVLGIFYMSCSFKLWLFDEKQKTKKEKHKRRKEKKGKKRKEKRKKERGEKKSKAYFLCPRVTGAGVNLGT